MREAGRGQKAVSVIQIRCKPVTAHDSRLITHVFIAANSREFSRIGFPLAHCSVRPLNPLKGTSCRIINSLSLLLAPCSLLLAHLCARYLATTSASGMEICRSKLISKATIVLVPSMPRMACSLSWTISWRWRLLTA